MLTELRIRDLAIIRDVKLTLAPGFNVLTGETGAGKSIIVGALGLLLGERATADLVRTGASRARVEAAFELGARAQLVAWLDERGIDASEGTLILAREVSTGAGGRSRAWINGSPTTAALLGEVARSLVNLHGQHESQTLLDARVQREMLDAYGESGDDAQRVRRAADTLTEVSAEITALDQRRREAERRSDYLRHVVAEIEQARLVAGEDDALEEEARRLTHVEELRRHIAATVAALDDPDGALARIAVARRELGAGARLDATLAVMQEQLETAGYALDELRRELERYAAGVNDDPARLQVVLERRDSIFRLKGKYGADIAAILATAAEARAELALLDSATLDLAALEQRRVAAQQELSAAAAALTHQRQRSAAALAADVDRQLPALGMEDGHFHARLIPRDTVGRDGAEDVLFEVALNVGHDARPLARVASGGELSRVMLALTAILARLGGVPTLVFDEVDSGIGGRVALQVGDVLRQVAARHQVLAITHLPQIASRAHHHVVVEKGAAEGTTTAHVRSVAGDERVTELARMLGGDSEKDVSRAHARDLLENVEAGPRRTRRQRA